MGWVLQGGKLESSLDALQKSLGLSSDLEEFSGDADVLGAIGDTYTELGNLEKAAEVRFLLHCMLLKALRSTPDCMLFSCVAQVGAQVQLLGPRRPPVLFGWRR